VAVCHSLRPAVSRGQLSRSSAIAEPGDAALSATAPALSDLERVIGHDFNAAALLSEALTHPSALASERGRGRRAKDPYPALRGDPRVTPGTARQDRPSGSGEAAGRMGRGYERLEFLGDRVLGLVVAELLWRRFVDESEGSLTRRHTHLVRRETLAQIADTIGLGRYLVLSRAERLAGAGANPAILADACEAVIAAIYLDGGFDRAVAFVRRFWEPLIEAMATPPRDPKTALQEWAQARGLGLPRYQLVATSGPDHAPLFTVAASVAGGEAAIATASVKRAAQAGAAAALLERLTSRD
jgi:ribonuclease III